MLRLYSAELSCEGLVGSSTSTELLSLVRMMDGKLNMRKEGLTENRGFGAAFGETLSCYKGKIKGMGLAFAL